MSGEVEQRPGVPPVAAPNLPSTLKRTTCDACRERKVRCDRTKPECLRCTRAGHRCTYPCARADAAKINETLQELQHRLAQAESKLQQSGQLGQPGVAASSTSLADNHPALADVDLSALGQISGDISMINTEDPSFYALDPRLMDDITTAFPSDGTSACSPLDDEFWKTLPSTETSAASPHLSCQTFSWPTPCAEAATRSARPVVTSPEPVEISSETSKRLFEAYFNIIQRHLPLVNGKTFMPNACPTHQSQALAFAVCMAGARVCEDLRHLEHSCYSAARWHLEQAELEIRGSSVWTLEATQALVLVARYELLHARPARAVLTLNRLCSILGILRYDRLDDLCTRPETQMPPQPSPSALQLQEARRVYNVTLSMRHRAESICPLHRGLQERGPGAEIHQKVAESTVDTLDPFEVFCISQRIAAETDRHQAMTAAEVEGAAPPSFNFCRTHSQIELDIGGLIQALTVSSPPEGVLAGLDSELRVLAILTALGARIQLIKTTVMHGRKATFLEPIFAECHKQNVSTAHDISEVVASAKVLDSDKIRIYREASLYIMPPLALAAESLLFVVQTPAPGSCDNEYTRMPRVREIRQSLEIIYKVMDICKDNTGRHDGCIASISSALESMQLETAQFRTHFTSFAVARSSHSPPGAGGQQGARERPPFA